MRHAILAVDETRRRVQQQRLGHADVRVIRFVRARKLLVIKATAGNSELASRLEALLALGDPDGEVAFAYSVKEAVARFKPEIPRPQLTCCATSSITLRSVRLLPKCEPWRDLVQLVRSHPRLASGQGVQRSHRGHEQPVETGQAGGLRVHQLRELPHPGPALRASPTSESSTRSWWRDVAHPAETGRATCLQGVVARRHGRSSGSVWADHPFGGPRSADRLARCQGPGSGRLGWPPGLSSCPFPGSMGQCPAA